MPGDLAGRLCLVVITDRALARPRSVLDVVEAALGAGAPCIQLRAKDGTLREAFELGRELRGRTRERRALFIVNDRFDMALALEADGLHLGPDDLPLRAVRACAAPGFLLGYSADDSEAARAAERDGADYLGCGAIWPTDSKADAGVAVGPEGLRRVVGSVSIPVVAIGGVTAKRAPLLAGSGAAGIAVIGAVMGASDPGLATERLLLSGKELPVQSGD